MYFDDVLLHTKISIPPVVIEKQKMLDFARLYDNIPLHTDEAYAKTTAFGELIAPGVMSFMSVWAQYLQVDILGEELLAGLSTKIEWHKPVFAEDTLFAEAEVTNLVERSDKNGIVELTFRVKNQHGVSVLTDVTQVIVKRRRQ